MFKENLDKIEKIADILDVDISDHEIDEDDLREMYDEMLDECCTCSECGRGGSDLKEEDPIAYDCGYADWLDSEVKDDNLILLNDCYLKESNFEELKDCIKNAFNELFN